jgi:hypothetical protein
MGTNRRTEKRGSRKLATRATQFIERTQILGQFRTMELELGGEGIRTHHGGQKRPPNTFINDT